MSTKAATGPNWLLIETFTSDTDPTILSIGRSTNSFRPLGKLFTNPRRRKEVGLSITRLRQENAPFSAVVDGRRIAAVPLVVENRLHGLWFWSQPDDVPVPDHPLAGAWVIDLTTYHALGSLEWAAMADVPEEHRGQERHVSAMFSQVEVVDGAESTSLSLIRGPAGAGVVRG